MKGWTELKDAFWAVVDDPAERPQRMAALAAIDPELPNRLEALLAADARGEAIQRLFDVEPVPTPRPISIGTYDVIDAVGAGGMGEVYRARDARLQRDVAIKILPASVSLDRERLMRFEREAQVLASLNHPHIAQVYGLEEYDGAPAIVMELVTGPTLATLIADYSRTPLTLVRLLTIARQIADGLDAAHEKGVIHRDLKPGNVALTGDGDAKILDFGVAKSLGGDRSEHAGASAAPDASGVLGTPAYMSPEQARGLTIDRRTDVWAFGCLLYELLTKRQAFGGTTGSDALGAVLERDPDMTILPAGLPASVRSLIRHCLEKDPKRRLRDIADARLALDDALNDVRVQPEVRDSAETRPRANRRAPLIGLVTGIGVAVAAALFFIPAAPAPSPPPRTVASIVLPRGISLGGSDAQAQASESRFAVSPDGRKLALVAAEGSGPVRLWLRDLGSGTVQPVPDTDDASYPFWSPDSESLGFVAAGKLKTIRISDGASLTVHADGFLIGAWSRSNLILFAPKPASPLYVVPAGGGTPAPVTTLDTASGEVQHGYPAFLPDGRRFLYYSLGSRDGGALDSRGIFLASVDGTEPARLLVPGATQGRYANGHLLFVMNGVLMAQRFELESGQLRGSPSPLVEEVRLSTAGATGPTAAFSVSENGVLVFQAALRSESRPVWFDRSGQQLAAIAAPGDYGEVALSPDAARVAVSVMDPARATRDLWVYDVEGGRGQRLTFDPGDDFAPVWSPDGTRLLFSSLSKGRVDLQTKEVSSASEPSPFEVDNLGLGRFAADWSRDGRHVMYIGGGRAIARSDLWIAPVAGPKEARPLLESTFVETHGRFAPRGRWFAYVSNETGQMQVYVDRFPDLGAKRLVSLKGGRWPRWSRDETELFFLSPENQLMAVAVDAKPDRVDVGEPRPLFAVRARAPIRLDAYPYDVSPDAKRFMVNSLIDDASANMMTVVLNWPQGLIGQ